jgi:peptidyl-prolyl cis-trans isomerase SurA
MASATLKLLGLLAILASASPLGARLVERIVVVIDNEPHTLSEVKAYAQKIGRVFPEGDLERLTAEDKAILELFITEKLVAAEIKRIGLRISPAEVDRAIEEVKRRNQLSDEELLEALRREGMSMERYRETIRAEIEKGELVNSQVRQRVNITQEDVERYYRQNQARFKSPEQNHLHHLLFPLPRNAAPDEEERARRLAHESRARALGGEDLGRVAGSLRASGVAAEGGDLGWIDRRSLQSEIEKAVTRLAPGQVSEPVRTPLGIHLVRVAAKKEPGVLPLAEVAEKIREELYAKAIDERYQKWIKTDLRRRYRVDVKVPGMVFRPEETKEATVQSLLRSSQRRPSRERSFLSYLNPLSYFVTETPVEEGPDRDRKVISVFGTPLFTVDSPAEAPDDPLAPPEPPAERSGSRGFLSSLLGALNPFSSSR